MRTLAAAQYAGRVDAFFHLVERRIAEAERAGAFANLPSSGRPLPLDELDAVPAELRASWLLLKGAGFVPPELEARKEWLRLQDLVAACNDPDARSALDRRAQRANLRYRMLLEQRGAGSALLEYADAVQARLARER